MDMENILVVFSHMVVWYLSESLPDNNSEFNYFMLDGTLQNCVVGHRLIN